MPSVTPEPGPRYAHSPAPAPAPAASGMADTLLFVRNEDDVVRVRQAVRARSTQAAFSLVDQTKLVTATSELARNMLVYAGGGEVLVQQVTNGIRVGLRIVFTDRGPGIPDVAVAMRDGYTSGSGLGLGLGGARRLVNEFDLKTEVGRGTTVTIVKWR